MSRGLGDVYKRQDYLLSEGYVLSHIAVERNEVIVSKKDYADTRIQDGDVIEIVQFMGGG